MRETCVAVLLCIVHMFNSGNFVFISKKKKKINNLNDGGDRRPQPDVLWDTDIRRRIANPPDQSLCSGDMAIWRMQSRRLGPRRISINSCFRCCLLVRRLFLRLVREVNEIVYVFLFIVQCIMYVLRVLFMSGRNCCTCSL